MSQMYVVISLIADSVSCLSVYATWHIPVREMSTQVRTIKYMVFNLVNAISAHLHSAHSFVCSTSELIKTEQGNSPFHLLK